LHFAFCISLLVACAKPEAPAAKKPAAPPPPTTEAATTLIANSPELGDYQFTHAAFTFAQKTPMNDGAKKLAAAKWIHAEGGQVVLSEKAKSDKRFLVRQNGFVDVVPLAKKEMIAVTAVRPQPDGNVLADFTWKWVPNELGTAIGQPPADEQKATAKLMWDGANWMVLSIV
jgi:hypothetical protein